MSAPALLDRVRARLALEQAPPSRAGVAALVREEAGLLGDDDVLRAVRDAVDELAGAGPLEPLLRAPGVTDVLVNGPAEVWVDRGSGLERAAVTFADDGEVRRLAVRLAAAAGRRLDDASPWVDVGLPDGSRLHAVLPPISATGTCLSLRVLRRSLHTLGDLAALGTLPGASEALVRSLVGRRHAFLVTGGTGSGKTTLLSALLGEVDPAERMVLCEDATELAPVHPHVVRLLTRPANVEGAGEVTLRDLVRQALRMRPDRLVVGEVRGAEMTDLLGEVDPAERMVLCEDATELAPVHPHVVRLLTRPANVEGAGEVTLRDLVRQALRMRPDRLVVGEVRGAEMTDLLAALNTGHDGGCGTLHANRPTEVPARLEALGVAAGLGRNAVHSQLAAALSVVVHLRRTGEGRQVVELGVVRRSGDYVVVESGWRADGGPCPAGDRLDALLAVDRT